MLTVMLVVNGAVEINVFLLNVNTSVNTRVNAEAGVNTPLVCSVKNPHETMKSAHRQKPLKNTT